MSTERDKIVEELFKVVQEKKSAIAKAEKPTWETNCAFRYNKNSSDSTNIHVCSNTEELVSMLSFLIEKRNSFNEAQKILGTSLKFKWFGYSFDEWVSDFKTRIDKIEISIKKKELEDLENRLDKLVSPQMREAMELAEIQKLLSK